MRSSFKRIGDYVQQVNARNSGLSVTNLQGVSINKYFMPSVANVNGTDLSTYKVVCKDQFAFNPMHVGRDEVLPIAMLETDDPVIVSPAYAVFETIDKQALLPEYLMMWCRRPEFDRNAWFTTDSSVRGGFSWDDFCEMRLPVPSPEKQREIVKEYHTIVDRIKLNERLNQKLEETAQAIYKQWFVDFEFPISAEYAASIGKPELEGQPYKSSGGEMVYNEVLKQEIPKEWGVAPYTDYIKLGGGGTPATDFEEYWNGSIPFFTPKDTGSSYYSVLTEKTITEQGLKKSSTKLYPKNTVFITARGTVGEIAIASKPMAMNQSCYAAFIAGYNAQFFVHQHSVNTLKSLTNEANGGVFGALVTRDFEGCIVLKPEEAYMSQFNEAVKPVYQTILSKQNESRYLTEFQDLLLTSLAKG